MMTKIHKYAEILRAIADGKQIQQRFVSTANEWEDCSESCFYADMQGADSDLFWTCNEYRVKPDTPAKEYPVTSYTGKELYNIYMNCGEDGQHKCFLAAANADIARYIDEQEESKAQELDKVSEDNDGWIVWNPPYKEPQGDGPFPDKYVNVMYRNGDTNYAWSETLDWDNVNYQSDIVAYKIIK